MTTQEKLKEVALAWGRAQLRPPTISRVRLAAVEAGVELEDHDAAELQQLIGQLKVVHLTSEERRAKAYRTDIPGRYPAIKSHMTLGSARAAVAYQWGHNRVRGGKIFELADSGWNLIHDVTSGTTPDELPWRQK